MDYEDILHRCFRCGFCKFTEDYQDINCPSYQKFGFDTYASGGRMWLIRGWLNDENEEIDNSRRLWEILYSCVTCGNCKEHCIFPFRTRLLDIFEAAKAELVEFDVIPPAVRTYFKFVKSYGNPYKEPQSKRGDWAQGTGIKKFSGHEYLLYIGDVGSYDERGKKMAQSVATLLKAGGISIGILGDEEESDGNDVKALGGRKLFKELAEKNIQRFNEMGVKKIITLDPHAFNTFTNDYPLLGGDFNVWHYTQILSNLIKEKKLPMFNYKAKVTYHDSCYLGRHNGVFNAPREILRSIQGLELIEMRRNKKNAFCCGGGGGNFFTDIIGGGDEGPGRIRIRDALDTGAIILAVSCPMCLKMLNDAIKAEDLEEMIEVKDITEIMGQTL